MTIFEEHKEKKKNFYKKKIGLKIYDKILIKVVSVLSIILLIIFCIYTHNAETSQVQLIELMMEKMSTSQKIEFKNYVNDKIDILKVIGSYPDIYKMDQGKQKEFIEGRSKSLGFEHIFIVDTNGTAYYIDENKYREQKNEVFFKNIMSNDIFITEPFYSKSGLSIITVCVSIYNEEEEKVGMLCGAINLQSINKLIEDNDMPLGGISCILNNQGQYMTSNYFKDVYNQLSIYDTENSELSLVKTAFKDKENKQGLINVNGTEYKTYITYLENYNWIIMQCIPISKIVEKYKFIQLLNMILTLLVSILIFCMIRIIYSWKKSDKKINTDSLTKCNSRTACLNMLEYLENKRELDITIIYIDLNKFKYANDTFGHDYGDKILCTFSDVLIKNVGETGFVSRIGGDEFIVVLINTSEEEINMMLKQVEIDLIKESKKLANSYVISFSSGYATRNKFSTETLSDTMEKADKKMYENKCLNRR